MEIILCCASTNLETFQIERLKKFVKDKIDWQPVLNLAIEHGLVNFLYYNLKNTDKELIPKDILSKLQSLYFQNSTRNLALSASLIKLLNLLKENNIDVVPFKGPVQAQLLYNDLGLRSFSDLDLLVKKGDAVKAKDLLISHGFKTDVEIPNQQIKTYLEKENFFQLANKSETINIDLHWEITGRYSLKPIYYEDLEDRFEQIEILGKNIVTLSIEDTLIHLCIHGTSHCWEKLELICSVAEIIKSKTINDWDMVIEKAGLLKCKRMVYLGSILAEQLFEASLPKNLKNKIDTDSGIQKLAKKVIEKIMNKTPAYAESLSWRFSSIHFSVRDSIFDQVRYAIRLFFLPTIREWDKYPLPTNILFLYYIIRPFRILSGLMQNLNIFSSNNIISASLHRYSFFMKKKEMAGNSLLIAIFSDLPIRIINKIWSKYTEFINLYLFNKFINNSRFNKFQCLHRDKLGHHYYLIVMPRILHLLKPCLELLPDDVNFFLILNGVDKKESEMLQQKFSKYPMLHLKLFPKTSLPHGRMLNLFFENNDKNFGIIDYDLFVFNNKIFKAIELRENEFVAGIYKLKNKKAGLVFPTTHFMFFNTKRIKQIMKKYKIGAQEYKRIPFRLKKKLLSINLGYHNFLKDYLYYFDTLNLIMAMAFYSKHSARILSINKNDCFHIGGNLRTSNENYLENLNLKIKKSLQTK